MPGAAFHSFYWSVPPPDIPNPDLGSSATGGYVPWQTTVARAVGFACGLMLVHRWAPRS